MGFVSEELNDTEKRSIQQSKVNNMAVVYGKEASMWKVQTRKNTHTNHTPLLDLYKSLIWQEQFAFSNSGKNRQINSVVVSFIYCFSSVLYFHA